VLVLAEGKEGSMKETCSYTVPRGIGEQCTPIQITWFLSPGLRSEYWHSTTERVKPGLGL
jgi:hypothetical protein